MSGEPEDRGGGPAALAGLRVLVVDDHEINRRTLALVLEPVAARLTTAIDGVTALELLAAERFDVVLMDVNMPTMDGLTATRHLLAAHPRVRVVIFTGALTPATACQARALGAAGYLLKDGNPADLPAQVRAVAAGKTVWSPLATALLESDVTAVPALPSTRIASPYLEETPHAFR